MLEVEAAAPMPQAPAQAYAATAMPSPFIMQPQAAYTDPTTQIQYVEVPQHHRQNMAMAHASCTMATGAMDLRSKSLRARGHRRSPTSFRA